MLKKSKKVIDLFAGCGGLSLGFMKDGYEVTKAVEFDPGIANTYQKNHPEVDVIVDDIRNIDRAGVFREGDADVIIGGPPCQGFSMAGARIRGGFMGDPRNLLFKHYFNIVKTVKPSVFIMENVKGITTMQNGQIYDEIITIFSDPSLFDGQAYHVTPCMVKAVDFGIPQKRERMILIGTLKVIDIGMLWKNTEEKMKEEYPHYFDAVTVKDAIGNLTATTEDGKICNPKPVTEYQKFLSSRNTTLTNHTQTKHSRLAIDRMKRVSSGQNYTVLEEKITSVHSGAYGRLRWDEAAPTVTTRFDTPAGGRFIHPTMDRTLSPREAARIQSFPDDFIFYGTKTSICRQIGNAVPPKISYFLARLIEEMIDTEGEP